MAATRGAADHAATDRHELGQLHVARGGVRHRAFLRRVGRPDANHTGEMAAMGDGCDRFLDRRGTADLVPETCLKRSATRLRTRVFGRFAATDFGRDPSRLVTRHGRDLLGSRGGRPAADRGSARRWRWPTHGCPAGRGAPGLAVFVPQRHATAHAGPHPARRRVRRRVALHCPYKRSPSWSGRLAMSSGASLVQSDRTRAHRSPRVARLPMQSAPVGETLVCGQGCMRCRFCGTGRDATIGPRCT